MNWKRTATAAMVVACGFGLMGCELATVNTQRDGDQLVLRVMEDSQTKKELNESYNKILQDQGVEVDDPALQDSIFEWKKKTIENEAKEQVLTKEALALGYVDKLSEEDNAGIDTQYQQMLDSFDVTRKAELEKQYEQDPEKDTKVQQDLEKEKKEILEKNKLEKFEDFKEELKNIKAGELYQKELEEAVSVSDEDVSAEYQKLMNEQKGSYDNDPQAYMSASGVNVYAPAGVRNIKQILIALPEDAKTKIQELETQKATLSAEGNTEGVAGIDAQIAQTKQAELTKIKGKANTALKATKSGKDFDQLIAQYNEDKGVASSPKGYPVHASATGKYVPAFQDAAMALPGVGALSELVETQHGYHILLYASDEPAGEVPLEQVAQKLRESVLTTKKSTTMDDKKKELYERYKKEGKLEIYPDRLKKAQVPGKK